MLCCLFFTAFAASCSSGVPDDASILGVGDSIFNFNGEESIPNVVGELLDRPAANVSVGGAWFSAQGDDERPDVEQQYDDVGRTNFDWVILDGGGNDLNYGCGCLACVSFHADLVAEDGSSGQIPDFVSRVVANGTNVMYVGYYEIPTDALFGFATCDDALAEHNRRLALMADRIDGVYFVDASEVVTASNVAAYDEDRIHPSPEGARLVAERVASAIREIEG